MDMSWRLESSMDSFRRSAPVPVIARSPDFGPRVSTWCYRVGTEVSVMYYKLSHSGGHACTSNIVRLRPQRPHLVLQEAGSVQNVRRV